MESVPLIIPLLDKEYRSSTRKLNDINQELRFAAYPKMMFVSVRGEIKPYLR